MTNEIKNNLSNKDIMDYSEFPEYDILYTDPPWENRMVKVFQTMLKKDTGIVKNHDIVGILNQLARLSNTNKPVVIEYSQKGVELVIQIMAQHGHKYLKTYHCVQKNKMPFVILTFNIDVPIDTTVTGYNIVTQMLLKTDYKVVFDPFAGIGQTKKAVNMAGKSYIGSELNPKRYAQLIK
jgi:hypothetical protein